LVTKKNKQTPVEHFKQLTGEIYKQLKKKATVVDLIAGASYFIQTVLEDTSNNLYLSYAKDILSDLKTKNLNNIQKRTYSTTCVSFSQKYLLKKQYKTALMLAKYGADIKSDNKFADIHLSLTYVLNNQWKDAQGILKTIVNTKGNVIYVDFNTTLLKKDVDLNEFIIKEIADMESLGITHPDFKKVKELVKER
jgi:hypothetical protein